MTRPSKAVIDLAALRSNYLTARSLHGGRALAVVKANAYGHGAVPCANALAEIADGFAVAFAAEAFELREAGITKPILVLEGCFDPDELLAAHKAKLWVVIHQESQLRALETAPIDAHSIRVWLKVDSGMHRAGFALEAVQTAYARLEACPSVASITLMTHFARADEPDSDATAKQITAFHESTAGLPGDRSLSNSGGILAWPSARGAWARPGILLYGADPLPLKATPETQAQPNQLTPVMSLMSEVFAIRTLEPGEALGYGGTFVATTPVRVGLVAIGYADGYPRVAPTGTPIAVGGVLTRTIGRVSMDMLTVDLTDLPQASIGSPVECWGKQIDVNQVAQQAGTIAYELLCNVKRVPKVYTD
ncbi:MAG: alanine racemase [Alcaligenaceae bacterium]|nr:MAG: alanine racemase [Alcaligenaceae bacterium]